MSRTRTILATMAAGLMTLSALPAAAAAPQQHNAPQQQPHGNTNGGGGGQDYGRWDARWGARPPAPPRSFARPNDWHRHVRACSQRYRSYNPRTDSYTVRRGVDARCRL